MSGDVATVRSTISAAIVGGPQGWVLSKWTADQFGSDSDTVLPHAYAVGISDTSVHQPEGRQRASEGLRNVESTAVVSWAHRIRGDNQVADYDSALDAEQDLVKRIKTITNLHIFFEQFSRRAGPEGYLLGQVRLRVVHNYALV